MTDELLQQDSGTDEAGKQTAKQENTQPEQSGEVPKFTQSQLDAILKDRLAREEKKRAEATENAKREAEEKELKEKQEWQKIAEAKEAEAKTLQQQLNDLTHKQLQADIAAKVGLPSAFATRLQGNTAEELEADAKALLENLPKPEQKQKSPGLHPTNPGGQDRQPQKTSQQLIQDLYGNEDVWGGGGVRAASEEK